MSLIETLRFGVHGSEAPSNSRFKGTLDSSSLTDYYDYTTRDEAKDQDKEHTVNTEGFFEYTISHTAGTFTNTGELKTPEQHKEFRKEIAQAFNKDGNMFWDQVISLESFDEAKACGLETAEDWHKMVSKVLPRVYKSLNLEPDNMIHWMDYHVNTEHPHIHLIFLEKEQTRTRGKIKEKQLKNIKHYFAVELLRGKDLKSELTKSIEEIFHDKDLAMKEVQTNVDHLLHSKRVSLKELTAILPKTGRLSYHSQQMQPYQPIINKLVDEIISSDKTVSQSVDKWMEKVEFLNARVNDQMTGEDIATLKASEMDKLYTNIGNQILKRYKESTTTVTKDGKTHKNKWLTKQNLKRSIQTVAQQHEVEAQKAIDEYYKQLEQNLII